jgi:acyl-CoA synthetase (AMP-forming)/AMP-acid ligase II
MLPAQVDVLSSLPQSPNGKIDRRALAAQRAGLFQETEV